MFEYDCYPPPNGTVKKFPFGTMEGNYSLVGSSLQENELKRMLKGASKTGETGLTMSKLLTGLCEEFDIKPVNVDPKLIPNGWHKVKKCNKIKITYKVFYVLRRITARATKDLKFRGVFFPADDIVASFLIIDPKGTFQFFRHFEPRNICCPDKPLGKPHSEETDVFAPSSGDPSEWGMPVEEPEDSSEDRGR
ncbi:hypothetical protein ACFLS9_00660 [Bacteroidota bacterium]